MKKSHLRFERLHVYQLAREYTRVCNDITKALPDVHADMRELLQRENTTIVMKIARGAGEFTRDEAYRTFRVCHRAVELSHSVLERLQLAGRGDADAVVRGLDLLVRIDAGVLQIIERIRQKLPMREVFRDS